MDVLDKQFKKIGTALIKEITPNVYKSLIGICFEIGNYSIPTAPVDTGHLRNSFTVVSAIGKGRRYKPIRIKRDAAFQKRAYKSLQSNTSAGLTLTVLASYTASYAIYVHETHRTNAKFFEYSINGIRKNILLLAKKYYTLPWSAIKFNERASVALEEGSRLDK